MQSDFPLMQYRITNYNLLSGFNIVCIYVSLYYCRASIAAVRMHNIAKFVSQYPKYLKPKQSIVKYNSK
jgi:hypothetical protein